MPANKAKGICNPKTPRYATVRAARERADKTDPCDDRLESSS